MAQTLTNHEDMQTESGRKQKMALFNQPPISGSNLVKFESNHKDMQTESDGAWPHDASNETLQIKSDDEPMQIDPDSDFPHDTPHKDAIRKHSHKEAIEGVVTEISPFHLFTRVNGYVKFTQSFLVVETTTKRLGQQPGTTNLQLSTTKSKF